jgi:hypothetical protein
METLCHDKKQMILDMRSMLLSFQSSNHYDTKEENQVSKVTFTLGYSNLKRSLFHLVTTTF